MDSWCLISINTFEMVEVEPLYPRIQAHPPTLLLSSTLRDLSGGLLAFKIHDRIVDRANKVVLGNLGL